MTGIIKTNVRCYPTKDTETALYNYPSTGRTMDEKRILIFTGHGKNSLLWNMDKIPEKDTTYSVIEGRVFGGRRSFINGVD